MWPFVSGFFHLAFQGSHTGKHTVLFLFIVEWYSISWTDHLMDWRSVSPPKCTCGNPNSQCDGIWRWGLWERIRFRWGPKGGPPWQDRCPYMERERHQGFLFPPCENTVRRQLFESQEEGSFQTRSLLAPWSWTSKPPELWEITCLLFKPSSLWYSVMAIQDNTCHILFIISN